ncbi:phytase [Cytidiella melzeri]|nr:phytase [Cytidiella melzeri]
MNAEMSTTNNDELQEGLLSGTRKALLSPRRSSRVCRVVAVALCSVALLAYLARSSPPFSGPTEQILDSLVPETQRRSWAQYAPYYSTAEYELPPAGCEVTQVNIIQRHGARFPTAGASERILTALNKIQSVTAFTSSRLDFLKTYKYNLGTDDLVQYGANESFESGKEIFLRYSELVSSEMLPFVRADISQRDIDSALNWTAGFSAASQHMLNPVLSVVIDVATGNDTLDGSQCPAAGRADKETNEWLSTYAPLITAQLNVDAPGAGLTDKDTYNLISLCPFETLATLQKSPWCTLFEGIPGAFDGFEYLGDLDKYYKTGYGQRLGPVQGVGYVNELIARLTESPVQDHTQTNHTLDDSRITFPLNRTLYIDFSHDNQMIAIFSAMGLFRQPRPLNPTEPDPARTWSVSAMVPFAGRMAVEKLSCSSSSAAGTEVMVRILVQDQIQLLDFCGADEDGLCTLDAFVRSQVYARNNGEGDWEECFK